MLLPAKLFFAGRRKVHQTAYLQILQVLHPPENGKDKKTAPRRKSVSKDVRIALNTIRQSLVLVTKSGIDVKTEEEDSDDFYIITVKIPKKK